jgi:2-methylcitrate dehydratase PrpD
LTKPVQPQCITQTLARYATQTRFEVLPAQVQREAARAFLNWMGCAWGGCRETAVELAVQTVADLGGQPQATLIGHAQRTDVASAAFVNAIASSVLGFDDAHLSTVAHPSSPVCSALLALSEKRVVSGRDFLAAIALGIEVTCRLSQAIVHPPSKSHVGFYVTGLTAPIGVALALGNLMRLDEQRMNWAISIAASQSGGFRATQGTMTAHFRPGHAARCGVWAALLAEKGFTGNECALEADKGFFDVFSADADLGHAVNDLGVRHEMLQNVYKPYPCGIVIHPAIDACLELHATYGAGVVPRRVSLKVHPLAMSLCGIREPATTLQSLNSLHHWAAAALVRGCAGVPEMLIDCISDPVIARLRATIEVITDPCVGQQGAEVEVNLADGRCLRKQVLHARGSQAHPISDDDLNVKFRSQAGLLLSPTRVEQLHRRCLEVADVRDVGREIAFALV